MTIVSFHSQRIVERRNINHWFLHMNNPMTGQTTNVQNYISVSYPDGHTEIPFTSLPPYEMPEALDRICEEYNRFTGNLELEPLIAIPVFIHDFLRVHPFNGGNGRISRLLTTQLLYRSGFYVGKYISLGAKIAKGKELYYDALNRMAARMARGDGGRGSVYQVSSRCYPCGI